MKYFSGKIKLINMIMNRKLKSKKSKFIIKSI